MPKINIKPANGTIFRAVTENAAAEKPKKPTEASVDTLESSSKHSARGTSLRDLASSGRVPFFSLNGRMTCGDYNL